MGEPDTDRVAVKTYVPRYQKELWAEHADRLDMSQSEFVRTMVQSVRRGFDLEPAGEGTSDADPKGMDVKERVVDLLRSEGPLGWEALLEGLAGDIEDRLESALDDLQAADRVRYSGRRGGYVVTGKADE